MANVVIDSGQPSPTDRPDRIPQDKWFDLFQVKRSFLQYNIQSDCRYLLEFVQDAEIMWQVLGFKSSEDMIRNGYELDPQEVELALTWLHIKNPAEATKYRTAVEGGKKARAERNQKIRELREEGKTLQEISNEVGITHQQVSNVLQESCSQEQNICKAEQAQQKGIGRTTQWRIDKIRRLDPATADLCESKQITVAEGERRVGLGESNYDKIVKMVRKLDNIQDLTELRHEIDCRISELNMEQ